MKYLIISLTIIFFSCAGGNTTESAKASVDNKKPSSDKKSCLAEITDPGKWFSIEKLSALVSEPEANIEKKVHERFNQLQFSWRNDRKYMMKVGKKEMEVPTNNVVAITIKNLDEAIKKATKMHKGKTFTYAEYFDGYHSQVTKEDLEIIDKEIDKKGEEDENFDAKTAKKILSMAPTEAYSDISDLGDDANSHVQLAPGLREIRMAILHGNVVVLLNVEISDEDKDDYAAARKIAEAVMGLCD